MVFTWAYIGLFLSVIDVQIIMGYVKNFSLLLLVSVLIQTKILGQISIPGQTFEELDKLNDTTSLALYTSIYKNQQKDFTWIDPFLKASFNSLHPRGYNDGAVWKGKGATIETHFGFAGRVGKLSFTFFPVAYLSQNISYFRAPDVGERDEFGYQFSNQIDWVQRYGNGTFINFHPGQSEIKLTLNKFEVALSTQNYSLGPSTFNPILLSRQSGGFPHLRFGLVPTSLQIGKAEIGRIEGNLIFGLLNESKYFDDDSENDNRFLTGLTLAYNPSYLPNLTLGFNKVLYKQTRYFEASDLFATLFIVDDGIDDNRTTGNDFFDQMASLTFDWRFKEVGFRAYGEFAKNDFSGGSVGFRFFATEPEHTRAYSLGFEKEITTKNGNKISINYEHTNLSRNHAHQWRPTPTYYTHGVNLQGYTHDGQIVGAGIGPGANSDHLSIKLVKKQLKYGLLIQRIEHNRDYFVVNISDANLHDVEYTLSLFLQKELRKVTLFTETAFSHNYNKYYTFMFDRFNFYGSLGGRLKL